MEGSPPRLPRNPTLSLSLSFPRPLSLPASLLSVSSRLVSSRVTSPRPVFFLAVFWAGEGGREEATRKRRWLHGWVNKWRGRPPLHHLPGKSKDRKDLSTCHDSPIGSPPIPYRPIPACQVIKRWLHGNNPEAKLLAALVNVSTSCQRFLYEDHAVLPWMPQTGRPPAASLSLSLFSFSSLSRWF